MDLTLTSTQSLTRNILGSIGVDGAVAHPLIISKAMMPKKTKEIPPTLNLFMLHPFLFVALEAASNIGLFAFNIIDPGREKLYKLKKAHHLWLSPFGVRVMEFNATIKQACGHGMQMFRSLTALLPTPVTLKGRKRLASSPINVLCAILNGSRNHLRMDARTFPLMRV
jgi:hypothetical protein